MNLELIISTIITTIFLIVIISYYILLFKKKKQKEKTNKIYDSISIIIPAHNEQRYIEKSINAAIKAKFKGKKQIIIINDGSTDNTKQILQNLEKKHNLKIIHQKHSGKAKSINKALKISTGKLIAIIDADSIIQEDALIKAIPYIKQKKVGIVCSTVKVANRKHPIGMYLHLEQLYNSLLRSLFTKMNVNIVAPGPLSIYDKQILQEMQGFSTKGYSEDVDIAIRYIKKGYTIEHAEESISETYMPLDAKGFFRQRSRFAKGWLNIFSKHLKMNKFLIEIYTLPLMLFSYFQAVIMGIITFYNIISGYITYFASKGIYMSTGVLEFLLDWISISGIIKWTIRIIQGQEPITAIIIITLLASLLVYPLYIIAILRYDKKIKIWHIIPILFFAPFWWIIMLIYIINLPEYFNKNQKNIWHKDT
ncbi:glycosyltransferase family 2 protein [Candidatus Woesearchaeota archaeon]|nr:glycosyltransferase family 2 protein [Candidatus Woesearchaeota archaeon]MCF7901424.1 glycosyltransferase family 2 protein [Candidatus Woesearchaeota archaeon]MCF8012963.1 glycosyltransferase family 2 protein [Candidatus Woesearchaeota archaeon]